MSSIKWQPLYETTIADIREKDYLDWLTEEAENLKNATLHCLAESTPIKEISISDLEEVKQTYIQTLINDPATKHRFGMCVLIGKVKSTEDNKSEQ